MSTDRILTIPNLLSVARLILIGVFLWLVLAVEANMWAVAVLAVAGVTDYLDGFIARRWGQVSRLGQVLDPLVDRITVLAVILSLAVISVIPWWLVALLIARDLMLLAIVPVLRSRGLIALPVHYLGKAATFLLFFGFPLLLAATVPGWWQGWTTVLGWALVIWGSGLYWYGAVLYVEQAFRVLAVVPRNQA